MNKELCRKVGEVGQDNLIAKLFPPAEPFGIKVAGGEGVLKRGTVMALSGTDYVVLDTETTGKANCVLSDPAARPLSPPWPTAPATSTAKPLSWPRATP